MRVASYYPVLGTNDVEGTVAFYRNLFGFVPAFEADWYVHLTLPEQPSVNLAILDCSHESVPTHGRAVARGILLNFEMEDVDAEYQRIRGAGATVLLPLRDEPWGQRHFIVEGPDGVMIDVIKNIEPSKDYKEQYLN